MTRIPARAAVGALLGVAAELVLVPVKAQLNQSLGGDVGLLPAIMVVLLAAWYGGLVPGAAATLAGALTEAWLFMAPSDTLVVAQSSDRVRLFLFVVMGLLSSWLIWLRAGEAERSRRHSQQATESRERADILAGRLEALHALGTELAQADTTTRIVDLLLAHGQAALLADGAAAFMINAEARRLDVLGSRGYPEEQQARFPSVDLDMPLPASDVARTGDPVFIGEPADYQARYAPTYARLGAQAPAISVAAVPMQLDNRRFGVLGFTWNGRQDLPEDRRLFIQALARLGVGALDRARLFDQERQAFRRLEATQRRLDLLSEAGRVFGLTLDFESTLRRVASLAIPMLGDVCIVDIVEGEALRRLVAVASDDLAAAAAALEQNPSDMGEDCPIAKVLQTGEPTTYARLESQESVAGHHHGAHSSGQAAALRTIGARWVHIAPLQTLDRTIGALTFLRRDDRGFDADETAAAAQLADRAAHAIENARLHRQVRRLAERESRRAGELEAVIGAVNEGFLVLDDSGIVQSSNAAARRLLGGDVATLEALLGRLKDAGEASPRELAAEPTEYRLRHRPAGWVEVAAYPVAAAGLIASSTVVVCRDVTAFRQGQALREAFMGLLSHELRTPVTTIYGGAALLTRPGGQLDAATSGEVLADIAAEADRLYRLVEDLLVLARFDEGFEVGMDPVLLQRIVPAVVEQERGRWPTVTFNLDVAPDLPAVSGDETSITQVLRNLLSNASKYSGVNATIDVVVGMTDGRPVIRVLDQGPGIDPAEAEHLFEAFYRSPSTATLAGGAGIGLYVSRRLIDTMGGRIWAAPRPGRGSEFAVSLPVYEDEEERSPEAAAAPPGQLTSG